MKGIIKNLLKVFRFISETFHFIHSTFINISCMQIIGKAEEKQRVIIAGPLFEKVGNFNLK